MTDMRQDGVDYVYNHRRAAVSSSPRRHPHGDSWIRQSMLRGVCRRDRLMKLSIGLMTLVFVSVNIMLLRGDTLSGGFLMSNTFTPQMDGSLDRRTREAVQISARVADGFVLRELRGNRAVGGDTNGAVAPTGAPSPSTALQCDLATNCDAELVPLRVSVTRGKNDAAVCFNGQALKFNASSASGVGGIVAMVADAGTLQVRTRVFDTRTASAGVAASKDLVLFLGSLEKGTILVMAADGAQAAAHLSAEARHALYLTGSGFVHALDETRAWAMATVKGLELSTPFETLAPALLPGTATGDPALAEVFGCLPKSIYLSQVNVRQRKAFCREYDVYNDHNGNNGDGNVDRGPRSRYGDFCIDSELRQYLMPERGPNRGGAAATGLPVTILARNDRPDYLWQCLKSLFTNAGLVPEMVTVYVDGYRRETHLLLNLFAVRAHFFAKTTSTSRMKDVHRRADTITAHYARVLPLAWAAHPTAKHMIVMEEDHIVSPDFLYFFSQLTGTVDKDVSIMAVSAYNDNGFQHAAQDSGIVYRVEFFPGRAWLLPLRTWNGWKSSFPSCCGGWSWDLWMREPGQRKGRETLIPDVPRAHHIGERGTQVGDYYWKMYFKNAALNQDANAELREVETLQKDAYQSHLNRLIGDALPLPTPGGVCGADMVPKESFGLRYVLFYAQTSADDISQLQKLVKCFKVWDLGVRGVHEGVFRFYCKYNHVMLVGSKTSYARALMPAKTQAFVVS